VQIAVAGKGGSGKTTIAGTMARLLARAGRSVVAIDGDSNPNLAVALGVPAGERERLRRVPREEILEERADASGFRDLHLTQSFEDVLREYGLRGPDRVVTLSMTGLLGAGRG
jgi:CO dehydrogenase maturation factor